MAKPRHILVIGGGITGALCAWELTRQGVQVTVLEAKEKGAGSSSRSAACIRQQFSTEATVRAMIHSVAAYARFREDMACGDDVPDVLVQNGYLFLHASPDRWATARHNVEIQHGAGLAEVELLSPAEITERFPQVDSTAYVGATFCPTDGFLRADLVYHEAFRRAVELGAVLRQHTLVAGGLWNQGVLCGVRTEGGEEIEADLIINATNAWAPRVSRLLGGQELPITPIKRYLYFLQRGGSTTAADMLRWPMTILPSRAYCRPENGEQMMLGWGHDASPEPSFTWEDQDDIRAGFLHKAGLDNHGVRAWMEMATAVPALAEFPGLVATTSGYYAMTPDHNPVIGFDRQQPRLLHAAGFSGHGAMLGPFTAKATSAMALAGHDLDFMDWDGDRIDLSDLQLARTARPPEGMVI